MYNIIPYYKIIKYKYLKFNKLNFQGIFTTEIQMYLENPTNIFKLTLIRFWKIILVLLPYAFYETLKHNINISNNSIVLY